MPLRPISSCSTLLPGDLYLERLLNWNIRLPIPVHTPMTQFQVTPTRSLARVLTLGQETFDENDDTCVDFDARMKQDATDPDATLTQIDSLILNLKLPLDPVAGVQVDEISHATPNPPKSEQPPHTIQQLPKPNSRLSLIASSKEALLAFHKRFITVLSKRSISKQSSRLRKNSRMSTSIEIPSIVPYEDQKRVHKSCTVPRRSNSSDSQTVSGSRKKRLSLHKYCVEEQATIYVNSPWPTISFHDVDTSARPKSKLVRRKSRKDIDITPDWVSITTDQVMTEQELDVQLIGSEDPFRRDSRVFARPSLPEILQK